MVTLYYIGLTRQCVHFVGILSTDVQYLTLCGMVPCYGCHHEVHYNSTGSVDDTRTQANSFE